MTTRDLGPLEGPVLLFGGNYSNRQATEALMLRADVLGIAPSNVVCTGDVVAYCAEPQATTAAIRDWGCHVVAGNCEEQLAAAARDCACGFEAGSEWKGSPMTYTVAGRQYVAIASGANILAFAVPEK